MNSTNEVNIDTLEKWMLRQDNAISLLRQRVYVALLCDDSGTYFDNTIFPPNIIDFLESDEIKGVWAKSEEDSRALIIFSNQEDYALFQIKFK